MLDVERAQLEYPGLRRRVIALAREHGARTVLIERAGAGQHLVQELKSSSELTAGLIGIRPEGPKLHRMAAASAMIEAGEVHLPERAPWLATFMHELLAFRNGRHDDQVDSVSQFLIWIQSVNQRIPARFFPPRIITADD